MTAFDHAVEVITEEDIDSRVGELGLAITEDFEGRDPLFAVVMTGSVPFAADLVRSVQLPAEVDSSA
jgi:hypoxanthine phosphoribosyltransferase